MKTLIRVNTQNIITAVRHDDPQSWESGHDQWIPCVGKVEVGFYFNPSTGTASQQHPNHVSPVEFKLLFTSAERIAIKAARGTDDVVDDFFSIVDDPRLTYVDLGLQSVSDALDYLISLSLIVSDRKAEILAKVFK